MATAGSSRSHHAPNTMILICAVGEGLNVSVWNELLFIGKKLCTLLSIACLWNIKCTCCLMLCDPPEQSGAPAAAAPQLQQFLTAEEAATWACSLGHGREHGSHKDTGHRPHQRDHVCVKTKVWCSTGWCLTSSPSVAASWMTRISPGLAARVRDLSCPACWLRYLRVLMFGGH